MMDVDTVEDETRGTTGVPCICGLTHRFSPSAMAVILLLGLSGELYHVVGKTEIRHGCLYDAIASLPQNDPRLSFYRGSVRFYKGEATKDPRVIYTRINGRGIAEPNTVPKSGTLAGLKESA